MSEQTPADGRAGFGTDEEIRELYRRLLDGWNKRSAQEMTAPFAEDGNVVGFDGSQMNGRDAIEAELGRIFADHQTSPYVGRVEEVRFLAPDVAVLRAVAGQVPPGRTELNPGTLTIQTLVAARQDGEWRVAIYHNTPAALHGKPELRQELLDELQQLV